MLGPGGQAATSSRIENYLGFPSGISGAQLAERAETHALKFGAQFSTPCEIIALDIDEQLRAVLSNGTDIPTRLEHRVRGALSVAHVGALGRVRRWHLLRRHRARGPILRGRPGHGRRRRERSRPGGALPRILRLRRNGRDQTPGGRERYVALPARSAVRQPESVSPVAQRSRTSTARKGAVGVPVLTRSRRVRRS